MRKGAITFTGKSGLQYPFHIWSLDTRFKPIGGVYFVTQRTADKAKQLRPRHNAIFIGQTEDLAQSFNAQALPERFMKLGANCICVHLHDDAERRLGIEKDLLAVYSTDCNDQRY
jgi:hypothetical protein